MLPDPEVQHKSKRWLDYADQDLRLARHALTMSEAPPYRLIAYHAQQCVEKNLKAYLVFKGVDFPYTHNISHLIELCATRRHWPSGFGDAEELTPFAVSVRCPGEEEDVTREEATRAVDIAARVRKVIREALGSEGLAVDDTSE